MLKICTTTAGDIRCDEYFSTCQLSKLSNSIINDFFLLHFNTRSLPKNKDKIENFLNDIKRCPDVNAILEIKLNENIMSKHNLSGYTLFRDDSSIGVGDVGLYLKDHI